MIDESSVSRKRKKKVNIFVRHLDYLDLNLWWKLKSLRCCISVLHFTSRVLVNHFLFKIL